MPTFRNTLSVPSSKPLKMEQIKCSETSAFNNQTPGKCPKDDTQYSKHGESLKSRKVLVYLHIIHLLKSSTCFEHYPAHLQEVYVIIVYMQPLVSSLSAGDCLVRRLRKFFLNRCTRQSPAESDDTRGYIYTVTTYTS